LKPFIQERIDMRRLFLAICVLTVFLGCSNTENNEYYSYEYLKNDFDQVAVCASVDVREVQSVDSIGGSTTGYVRYRIRCRVIEPFKGDIKKSQALEYYSVAEKGYNPENYRGKKIVFLGSLFDDQKGGWFLSELENSSRPASKAIIKKMRQIKSQAGSM
jgi:hypothetical protein